MGRLVERGLSRKQEYRLAEPVHTAEKRTTSSARREPAARKSVSTNHPSCDWAFHLWFVIPLRSRPVHRAVPWNTSTSAPVVDSPCYVSREHRNDRLVRLESCLYYSGHRPNCGQEDFHVRRSRADDLVCNPRILCMVGVARCALSTTR